MKKGKLKIAIIALVLISVLAIGLVAVYALTSSKVKVSFRVSFSSSDGVFASINGSSFYSDSDNSNPIDSQTEHFGGEQTETPIQFEELSVKNINDSASYIFAITNESPNNEQSGIIVKPEITLSSNRNIETKLEYSYDGNNFFPLGKNYYFVEKGNTKYIKVTFKALSSNQFTVSGSVKVKMFSEIETPDDYIMPLQYTITENSTTAQVTTAFNRSSKQICSWFLDGDCLQYADNDTIYPKGTTFYTRAASIDKYQVFDGVASKKVGATGEIVLGQNVTAIANDAFAYLDGVTSILLPNTIETIGENAFNGLTNLQEIVIPNKVTEIKNSTFINCANLQNVVFLGDVIKLGNSAFANCANLYEINLFGNNENIDVTASSIFNNCSTLNKINVKNLNLIANAQVSPSEPWLNNRNLYVNGSKIKEITLENVSEVSAYAFSGCLNINSVVIESGVTKINNHCFADCLNLKSFVAYSALTTIEPYSFENDENLKIVKLPNSLKTISNYAFSSCLGLKELIIPDGTLTIGDSALQSCTSLTNLNIPKSVTSIGIQAFANCSSLQEVTVENNSQLTSLGAGAFLNCTKLISFSLPNIITAISNNLFWHCTSLQSIIIPSSLISIGRDAFGGCNSLNILYEGEEQDWLLISGLEYIPVGSYVNYQ